MKEGQLKILFVEDNQADVEIIQRQLKREEIDFAGKVVESADGYLDEINLFKPDLIISDYSLPQLDGMQALMIRNDLIPAIPFILVTGSINEEIAVNCIKSGADDYILKNSLSRLGEAVKSSLKKKEIIEQKEKAVEALMKSEREFQNYFESGAIGMSVTATDKSWIQVNEKLCNIFGYSREELMKITWVDITHPDDLNCNLELFNKVIAGEIDRYELDKRFIRKDGVIRYVNLSVVCQRNNDNTVHHFLSSYIDITERKKMEEKIIESETYYKTLIDVSPDGIFITDFEGAITFVSRKIYDIFGIPPGSFDITETSILDWVSPDYQEAVIARIRSILAGNVLPEIREYRLLKYDGTPFWAELSSSPLDHGKKGLMVVCRDITERKKAADELLKAKEKAEESDRLKSAFLHNISHEIRTPMNAIVGFTALLSEPGLSRSTIDSYIEVIMSSSNHLLSIISDIIDISNIEANIVRINKTGFQLNAMFRSIYNQFLPKANDKKIILELVCGDHDRDSEVLTDSTRLNQVISNLLSNAFKFTSTGKIKFGYDIANGTIYFFVEDTGIGIHPEHQKKIFDRFYQVEDPETKLYEGTGLGLSISRAYSGLLGGELKVISEPGKGSVFYFSIPYEKPVHAGPKEVMAINETGFSFSEKKQILVAEDIDSNFKLIQYFLKGINAEIIRASNGKEAVEKVLSGDKIDLILMDIKMPVMDGLTATRIIKESKPGIPIIAQTAYADDVQNALDSGCSELISKPFDKKRLLEAIEKILI